MEATREFIYKTFDTEGIKFQQVYKFGLSYDIETSVFDKSSSFAYLPYEPQIRKFNISREEFLDFVLEYIYDTTSFRLNTIYELENYPSIDGKPFLLKLDEYNHDAITYSLAFGRIPGSITFRKNHKIKTLGNINEIDGTLGLSNTSITSFGNLKKVKESLWISYHDKNSNLDNLNEIEEIGGSLLLRYHPIKSLSKLKSVGGTLNLRSTQIEDLGQLSYVGEHIYFPKSQKDKFNFDNINVQGKIKYFST